MYANTFDNDDNQNQCDSICFLNINEIDMSKFISGTYEEKHEIALLFDKTFHEYGVIRLINTNITSDLIDKTKEFFSLSLETKLKYYVNGSFYDTSGYKPTGLESVANYKGQKKASPSDSVEVFFYNLKSISKHSDFSIDQLPELFRDVIPEYILKARQLISYVHSIADMALELDDNTFDKNYTSDDARFSLRLAKYLPIKNGEQLALGEHQDYLGFTLIQNDNVSGLDVNVNGRWFRVEPKPDTLLLVGGEFIERWTNNYWISILHRVASVQQFRYSALFFSGPDMNSVIQTLPCKKCMQQPSKYTPVTGYEHLEQRKAAIIRN
ncbi:unnamed protein product [Rotaria sp. Silwood1]|nr:unnamed protein product [Rotaria sp. Silwood1]CAF3718227.1 unnamed protein product [Rotaria sp. Silwood1]CAF4624178.1 unnamed protein product [Rotaria sp. Silwood1]CAF4643041.1 unnamed protein product [Rotaria sp. Silwood1]